MSAADDVKARALVAVRQVLPLDADAMWDATAQATIVALAAAGLLADPDALARAKAEAWAAAAEDPYWKATGFDVADRHVIRQHLMSLARAARIDPTEGTRG